MLTTVGSEPIIRAPLLDDEPWLAHGFGLKDIAIEKYLKALLLRDAHIPQTHQTHGNDAHVLSKKNSREILEGDIFLSAEPGVVCWVRTADCLPILIADPKKKVVGAVHAGWRGTASKAVLAALDRLKKEWGSRPADLKVAFGPAIGGRCYRVGEDCVRIFETAGLYPAPWFEVEDRRHWTLDIAYANLYLLERAGVSPPQIYFSLACTACDPEKFHSFRGENGKKGEQVGFIVRI